MDRTTAKYRTGTAARHQASFVILILGHLGQHHDRLTLDRGNPAGMTISVVITNPANEILDSLPVAESLERFHLEPRCRVCRNDDMRKKVNDLLAAGRSCRHRARRRS